MPVRVQLSRQKGFRLPDGAVVVSRPSKWGNPYLVTGGARSYDAWVVECPPFELGRFLTVEPARDCAVKAFETALRGQEGMVKVTVEDVRRELRGKDLACWCPPGQPCHADVLLRIANEETTAP